MRAPLPFGKYLLLERISVGGMAEVFKAKSFGVEGFEKIIAIKRILPSIAEDQEFIQMFIDEAKISGQLSHANICQIFELDRIGDSHFIAMEFVWGKDLLQIQNRFRKLRSQMPMQMCAFVAAKMCEGLDYAHRKKDALGRPLHIIHRDVSPQNILISYEGEVKVIDFGIAKAASRSSKTQAGVLKGKFGYMSPEQVRGLPLDRRSDVFAIGTILYEMITGERLFLGESDFSTLEKVRNVDVQPPSAINKQVPPGLERIAMKALSKTTEDRYQWAKEMQEDLQAYLMATEPVYTARQLSQWMKDAFSPELEKERALLESYKRVGREALTAQAAAHPPGPTTEPSMNAPIVRGGQATVATLPPTDDQNESTVVGETPAFDTPVPSTRAMTSRDDRRHELDDRPLDAAPDSAPTEAHGSPLDLGWDDGGSHARTAAATPGQIRRAAEERTELAPQIQDPSGGRGWQDAVPVPSPMGPSAGISTPTLIESRESPAGYGAPAGVGQSGGHPGHPGGHQGNPGHPGHGQGHMRQASLPGMPAAPRGSILPPSAGGPPIPFDMPRVAPAPSQLMPERGVNGLRALLTSPEARPFLEGGIAGAAALLLVVGAYFAFRGGAPSIATGVMLVTTGDVLPAEVWVDGAKRGELEGNDHLKLANLLPGPYKIEVRRAGVPACEREAQVAAEDTAVVHCRPEVVLGRLRLMLRPGDAIVSVDGIERTSEAGRQPMPLEPGAHQVVVKRAGFEEQVFTVKIEPDKQLDRTVELAADSATAANVGTEPPKPRDRDKDREKAIDKDKARDRERDRAKERVAVPKPPEPKPPEPKPPEPKVATEPATGDGYLIANTTPWARVLIDNKDTGKMTPIAPRSRIALPPGKHTVTFVVGDKKFSFPITIEAGKDLRLVKTLPI